jgi:hypothetical protein
METLMTLCRKLAFCLIAVLCTGIASAQVAYVYLSANTTTYAYDVSSTGALTPITGSPFTTAGTMIGTNGSYFITIGSEDVYSNKVAANGAIGEQVSEINTQDYTGAVCGDPTAGGRANPTGGFDQTGQNVYIPLYEANSPTCDAIQTFKIAKTGALTFSGATIYAQGTNIAGHETVPTLLGNNKFAFNSLSVAGNCDGGIRAFSRDNSGTLNNINFTETDPIAQPIKYIDYLATSLITADPTNHVAIMVEPTTGCHGSNGPAQLASYTVDSQGNLTSTNTYVDMPTVGSGGAVSVSGMQIDPTGKFLALAVSPGIQLYHFNGAKPITPFAGSVSTPGSISQLRWDQNGHLYAQEGASGAMHVYKVTSAKVTELSGSPTLVPVGQSLIVRSK